MFWKAADGVKKQSFSRQAGQCALAAGGESSCCTTARIPSHPTYHALHTHPERGPSTERAQVLEQGDVAALVRHRDVDGA